jgi:hypothetical protein
MGPLTCHRRLSEPLTPQTFLFRPTSKRASSFNGFQLHHHTDQTDKIVPEEKNGPSRDLTKPPEWIIPARRQASPDPCWSITKTVVMPYADRFHASLIPFSILTPVRPRLYRFFFQHFSAHICSALFLGQDLDSVLFLELVLSF